MESIKKLRASVQLAEMRLKAESSESNLSIYQLAKAAYDDATALLSNAITPEPILTGKEVKTGANLIEELKKQGKLFNQSEGVAKILDLLGKSEVEKIEQVSGEIQNSDLPEDTSKDGDASAAFQQSKPAEKAGEQETEEKPVDPIAENVEPISEPATEEKKTEVEK